MHKSPFPLKKILPWYWENLSVSDHLVAGHNSFWQIDGEKMETVTDFISSTPKSLQTVTEAMKLKDACSLEEKLWQT